MAMIQVLGNRMGAKTLGEWSDNVAEHVDKYFSHSCTRVDLVFDRYIKQTIKSTTRGKRTDGKKGIRRNVLSRTQAQMGQIHTIGGEQGQLGQLPLRRAGKEFQE
ncbi:hypothetical protein ACOMHN_061739 [Nucella lapillus]